jgi:hypothetical protein
MLRRFRLSWSVRVLLTAAAVALSLAPLRAQPAATLIQMAGQVSVLKDGYPHALFKGNPVQPKQIIVTGADSYAQFQVSDGSTFEVFSNAKVAFRDNYPNWSDLVQLLIGRIRVHIDHSKGPNPNSVATPTAVISVRGTTFDVSQEEDASTVVTVEEGIVGVRHLLMPGREVELHANESIRVIPNQALGMRQIDKGNIFQKVMDGAKEALYRIAMRPTSTGGNTPAPVPTPGGPNTDKGKGDSTASGPAAPPPPPAPTPPGGGGGG